MITRLQRLTTGLSIIQEIPETFFSRIENSGSFGNHLFPAWSNTVFAPTSLSNKFEAVFNKYKAIPLKHNRDEIVNAFTLTNQIENLCTNQAGTIIVELSDLPISIREEIDTLFLYLYNTALKYTPFETHVSDSLKLAIDNFIRINGLGVCPFCGLEGFLNIEGQSRIALDHWLCKDLFPMAAVNFDNLFPIGYDCNGRATKGSKNILIDSPGSRNRVKAYYPYLDHGGVYSSFKFVNEPTIHGISDTDWTYSISPAEPTEQDIFESWNSVMNISHRYLDYFRKNIFLMWEADYKEFIDEDHDIEHAQTIDELKENFKRWKAAFPIKRRPGAILYRAFIDHLINDASDAYLYGLCENFKR
ncbi:hypothetical protein [uncultured Draconibacterium sp.]|uniref:hypothetical protein n=1 Tax=uncultured Draconibacterium sp. TaxID=1573823 RepID=UPI002AA6DE1D|nr:hypothetical protein [uncultured Draconibacterium sp.]